jgi:hypothetical protein
MAGEAQQKEAKYAMQNDKAGTAAEWRTYSGDSW